MIEFAVFPGRTVEAAAEEFGKIVAVAEAHLKRDFINGEFFLFQKQIGRPG